MKKNSIYLQKKTYKKTRLPTEKAVSLIPDAYTEKEFFELENKQIFRRYWVCAGVVTSVQNAGDLMIAEIGEQSIIICRDESGKLQAFYNVCRHRGCRLFEKNGKIKKHIVCPYHGWGYSLQGDCIGTPLFNSGTNRRVIEMHDMSHLESFAKKDYGLFKVRVEQWGILVFVCLDNTAPPLSEFLEDLPQKLANFHLNEWQLLKKCTYDIRSNWKLLCENAIEYYHLPWVHRRLAKTSRVADHHRWQGSGMYCGISTYPLTSTDDSNWLDIKNLSSLNEKEQISGYFFCLFPNLIVFMMPSHAFIIKAHPLTPDKTIETAWLVAHPECIVGTKQKTIDKVLQFWDDVNKEDVGICEKVQQGLKAEPYLGGRLCYHFEEPVHRFQNMVADAMLSIRKVPAGDN